MVRGRLHIGGGGARDDYLQRLDDMSGDVWEWTSTLDRNSRANCVGGWDEIGEARARVASPFYTSSNVRFLAVSVRARGYVADRYA